MTPVTPATRRRADRRRDRASRAFTRLVHLMETLRSPAGCPWDRKQTPRSLRPFLLEESYEALDAIDRGHFEDLKGELGDVIFQCVFQAQLAAEAGHFDIGDAVQSIVDKLIRRHPHVFTAGGRPLGSGHARRVRLRTPAAVLEQWEQLKANEQAAAGAQRRVLSGVPRALPSLVRAHEISSRVAAVGFDWTGAADVMTKIEEEVRELREALGQSEARAAEELGDLLFAIANLARKLGLEAESALRESNDKFSQRFAAVEDALERRGTSVHQSSLEEMEAAWAAVKMKGATRPTRSGRAPSGRAPLRRPSRSRSRRRGPS